MMFTQRAVLSRICFLLMPLGLSAAALVANAQTASAGGYVALGDSLPFGLNPAIQPPDLTKYTGYPKLVAESLTKELINASCPGESSSSILDPAAPDLGCAQWKAATVPPLLYVPYTGAQMDYAISYLKTNPGVDLVTLNIGGNDLALLQISCNFDVTCAYSKLPETLARFAQNLMRIYGRIRLEARYRGKIIAVNYFAFNYSDPVTVSAFIALNSVLASISSAYNVAVADAFQSFNIAAAPFRGDVCAAGLLLPGAAPGACDTHPNAAGQRLLADTVLAAFRRK
jgi:lysophospholipase L1-like esterase